MDKKMTELWNITGKNAEVEQKEKKSYIRLLGTPDDAAYLEAEVMQGKMPLSVY